VADACLIAAHSFFARDASQLSQFFSIHPDNPQPRLIRQAVDIVRAGGVVVTPTDSCYALGCHVGDKTAMERIRAIRGVDARHHFGLLCRSLAEAAVYARIDNRRFRLIKAATPGSYTFILHATREVPRRLLHPRRKTIGVRIPAHRVMHALLAELGEPLLSSTLILPDSAEPLNDAADIRDRLEHRVDLVIDGGSCGVTPTTVVDLTGDTPLITRQGRGAATLFGELVGA
jgi:tRNA threonylcarbamoyl adenosine modification protein (Sua5/YciO/YrdC/YwlC family)